MGQVLPLVILPLLAWNLLDWKHPLWLAILLQLAAFFVAAMVCHGELFQRRPPSRKLTEFYMWMAVGGILGGLFNTLVAPVTFNSTVEYPLALIAACLLNPLTDHRDQNRLYRWLDFALPLGLGALVVGLVWAVESSDLETGVLSAGLINGLPLILCFSFHERPIRFGLSVGAILLATTFSSGEHSRVLHSERSFFGVHRVMVDASAKYRLLMHGSTNHGMQSLDPSRRNEPLSYYYPNGPIGQVFQVFSGTAVTSNTAIVGLGTGSMACYGRSGEHFVFYEIDPVIERIARNPRYFTFLQDCPPKIDVVLGDARLSLRAAPDRAYGLIILDAFSSDTIPIHLLTREAISLYISKLATGGILAFHASNQYLNLQPILSDLARDAGLISLTRVDSIISEADKKRGKLPSRWVVMARQERDLIGLSGDLRWVKTKGTSAGRVWTDDFSNILSAILWHRL